MSLVRLCGGSREEAEFTDRAPRSATNGKSPVRGERDVSVWVAFEASQGTAIVGKVASGREKVGGGVDRMADICDGTVSFRRVDTKEYGRTSVENEIPPGAFGMEE